jgi:hypothetical protein
MPELIEELHTLLGRGITIYDLPVPEPSGNTP